MERPRGLLVAPQAHPLLFVDEVRPEVANRDREVEVCDPDRVLLVDRL